MRCHGQNFCCPNELPGLTATDLCEKCLKEKLIRDAHVDRDGVVRWNSNGSVPPVEWVVEFATIDTRINQLESLRARDVDLKVFLARYRETQPAMPSMEEQVEMRAAFGPGVEVVDVIMGRRFRTGR